MLGRGPISSAPISGSAFGLIAVPLALAATITFSFAINARVGALIPMSSRINVTFAGTPTLYINQALSATGGIAFGGLTTLRLAGKPIVLSAVPVSYTLRATPGSYTLKAMSEQFTTRGVR